MTENIKNNNITRTEIKLESLLAITKAINKNLSSSDMFRLFEFMLGEQLGIPSFAFYMHDDSEKWPVIFPSSAVNHSIKVQEELSQIKEITLIPDDSAGILNQFQVVIPVFHKNKALAHVLIGGMKEDLLLKVKKHDLEFIQTISNIICVAIENKRLYRENMQQELLKKEMGLAKEMQSMLFPSHLPNDEIIEISAYYQPQRTIGGDYYDFIRLNKKEVLFCLADVSGKGISAALLMANFQANLRLLANRIKSLPELISELNTKVLENAKGERFVTFFIGHYDSEIRTLQYINAGHNPPLLRTRSGIEICSKGCIALGIMDQIDKIEVANLSVPTDSFLFCYTDGVVEQENEGGKDFGIDLISELLIENRSLSASAFNEMLAIKLSEYKGELPFFDDIAMLSCRFH